MACQNIDMVTSKIVIRTFLKYSVRFHEFVMQKWLEWLEWLQPRHGEDLALQKTSFRPKNHNYIPPKPFQTLDKAHICPSSTFMCKNKWKIGLYGLVATIGEIITSRTRTPSHREERSFFLLYMRTVLPPRSFLRAFFVTPAMPIEYQPTLHPSHTAPATQPLTIYSSSPDYPLPSHAARVTTQPDTSSGDQADRRRRPHSSRLTSGPPINLITSKHSQYKYRTCLLSSLRVIVRCDHLFLDITHPRRFFCAIAMKFY